MNRFYTIKVTEMMNGWRCCLKAGNGKIILWSNNYRQRHHAVNAARKLYNNIGGSPLGRHVVRLEVK